MTLPHFSEKPIKTTPNERLSEYLGDPYRRGEPLPITSLISLADMTAGRQAFISSNGPVVTGCIDHFTLYRTPCHGDLVHATSKVLYKGNSSIILSLQLNLQQPPKGIFKGKNSSLLVADAMMTFVAVDSDTGRPRTIHSAPSTSSDYQKEIDHIKSNVYVSPSLPQQLKATRSVLYSSDLPVPSHETFNRIIKSQPNQTIEISDTEISVRRQFLPRHLNFAGIVFGGDAVKALEEAALATVTPLLPDSSFPKLLNISALSFKAPISPRTPLDIHAKVVWTSKRVACVFVKSFLDKNHDGTNMILCHSGLFYVVAEERETRKITSLSFGVDTATASGKDRDDFARAVTIQLPKDLLEHWSINE